MSTNNNIRSTVPDAHRPDPAVDVNYAQLHKVVSEFNDQSGITRDIEVLAILLNGWLRDCIGSSVTDQIDPNKTYVIRDHHQHIIYSTTQMMVNVARIKEAWRAIEQAKSEQ